MVLVGVVLGVMDRQEQTQEAHQVQALHLREIA
jgi:hypothetical protein